MSTFVYKGFSADGRKTAGSVNMATEELVKEFLNSKEIMGYEIFKSETVYKSRIYANVSSKELSIFCKQMSVMFYSHITLMEGILILAEQTENKQLKIALAEIHEFMNQGITFAEAMSMYKHIFTTYLLNMITIGETSGTLHSVFSRMSDYYDKESKIRKKLKSAIMYPAILTTLMAAIVLLLILKILPMFNDILSSMGGEIPSATKVILAFSSFFTQYFVYIVIILAIGVFAFMRYIKTDAGQLWYDKMKMKISVLRFINTRVVTARFSRSLAILIKSGVQLLNAMEEVTMLIDNKYLEKRFLEAVQGVREGKELEEVLAEIGIFPALFLRMVVIGQKTGNLDEMLTKSATVFDDEVDEAIERVTVMIEPILIIVLSVIVGIILLSVILPMISIMTAIG